MKRVYSILIACLFVAPLYAQDDVSSLLAKGNSAYESEHYQEASDAYTKVLEQEGPDASLLYNLGNAHYRLEQYGQAILDYERALALDPRASDVRTNLELARKATTAFEEKKDRAFWEKPLHWLSFNEWLLASAIALCALAAVSLTRAYVSGRRWRSGLRWATAVSVAVFFFGVSAVVARYSELDRAVVVRSGAEVRLSPFDTADVVATLKEGHTVQIGKEHEGFYHVSNGWVSKDDVKRVFEES